MKEQDMNKENLVASKTSFQLILLSALALAALPLGGCMSTGYNKSDATARSLEQAAVEVQAQSHALDVTVAALNDLVSNPAPDFRPQFITFSRSLDQLLASAKRNEVAQK